MGKVRSDQSTRERLLNDILISSHAAKPSKTGAGLRFSLKTLLIAVAIVALFATSAFAAYGAGLNGQIAELQGQIDELQGQANLPTDVKELNEIIATLQDQNDILIEQFNVVLGQNGELSEQLEAVLEEVEELRKQINATQHGSKNELPNPKGLPIQLDFNDINFNSIDQTSVKSVKNFSSMEEAREYLNAPFKVANWVPEGMVASKSGIQGNMMTNGDLYPAYASAYFQYLFPDVGYLSSFEVFQYYFGPNHQVININTIYEMETVVVGNIEVTVVYDTMIFDLSRTPPQNRLTLQLYWMDEDDVFYWMRCINPVDLETALAIVASMGEPIPAK